MKKGFTLVLIRLLLGMAMKDKVLVEASKIKSDVAKVQKLSSAFYTYYTKYSKILGEKADGTYTDKSIGNSLLKEGLITKNDLILKITPAMLAEISCYWNTLSDDNYICGGDGRKIGATYSPYSLNYKACSTYKNMAKNNDQPMDFAYLFKILNIN